MQLACLSTCDVLVFGSHAGAMALALTLAGEGHAVTLAASSTCLYGEHTQTGDWRIPAGVPQPWASTLYPESVTNEDGLLHPDRTKRHGEALMAKAGVSLLYAVQLLDHRDGYAVLAHKSGPFLVRCARVYDCTAQSDAADCFCLHVMQDGQHRQLLLPTSDTADTPQALYARYQQALDQLPQNAVPARSGTSACRAAGLPVAESIARSLALPETHLNREPSSCRLIAENPVRTRYAQVCCALPAPQEDAFDVLVVGGGTAGAAAALFCARAGLSTCLIEMNDRLGGTATVGGVSTYWFGHRGGASKVIDEAVAKRCAEHSLPRKTCLWNDDDVFIPDVKAHALLGLCLDAGVTVRTGCIACAVMKKDRRVTGVYYAQKGHPCLTQASMILDCTGDGDIAMLAGADHVYGNNIDGMTYWGSLAQYTAPDRYKNNFSTMVHVGDPIDYTRFIVAGRTLGDNTYDHGQYVAVRESRHIRGMETVTLEDILAMKPVADPLYVCFSNYDPKGRLTAELCSFGLLPPNQRIPIPRGAVIPVTLDGQPMEGLLVGGKAISCTHDALPALRMQPDLQQQGLALAALCACCLAQGKPAWEADGVRETILRLGGELPAVPAPQDAPLGEVIASLTGEEPWEWLHAPVDSFMTDVSPIIRIMTAEGEHARPLLRDALKKADTPQKQLALSRLLLWHKEEAGAPAVLQAIQGMLAQTDGLPRRAASTNYGQMLPDHGLMPEAVYLINSLAHAPGTDVLPLMCDVLDRLERTPRDWRDLRAGIYCWCESFAFLAIRRRDASLAPLIRRVLALPEFGKEPVDRLLSERLQMLRLTLLHALHLLGCADGTWALQDARSDARLVLSLAAEFLLAKAQ